MEGEQAGQLHLAFLALQAAALLPPRPPPPPPAGNPPPGPGPGSDPGSLGPGAGVGGRAGRVEGLRRHCAGRFAGLSGRARRTSEAQAAVAERLRAGGLECAEEVVLAGTG